MTVWHIWAIIALLFIILEIFTAGFAVACFAFGAAAAAVCAAFELSVTWQVLAFSVVSALAFVSVRPLVLKYFFKKSENIVTNADAVIGRRAKVTERIDPSVGTGRVAIDGDDWKAVSADNSVIEEGTFTEVVSRESIILTVKK